MLTIEFRKGSPARRDHDSTGNLSWAFLLPGWCPDHGVWHMHKYILAFGLAATLAAPALADGRGHNGGRPGYSNNGGNHGSYQRGNRNGHDRGYSGNGGYNRPIQYHQGYGRPGYAYNQPGYGYGRPGYA